MYFYLNKENLLNGEVVIVFQTENQIPNYKEITNFGELVEFKGESIPANWEYSKTEDTMYSIDDKPSPFHTVVWYFEDNFQHIMNLQELIIFASYGKGFIDGVYSAENYFKTLEEPKLINKDDYLAKIKEFMAGGN